MSPKSTPEEIRQRFDGDVERFSTLDTGQTSTMDAALVLNLIALAAARSTPPARSVLDLGCGAGNFTIKLLQHLPDLECTLVDLSLPMLERVQSRIVRQSQRSRATCARWNSDTRRRTSFSLPPCSTISVRRMNGRQSALSCLRHFGLQERSRYSTWSPTKLTRLRTFCGRVMATIWEL